MANGAATAGRPPQAGHAISPTVGGAALDDAAADCPCGAGAEADSAATAAATQPAGLGKGRPHGRDAGCVGP